MTTSHDTLSQVFTGGRCYLIAEAGSNHNRDWALASQLVDAAADAGADAVKFQLFSADRLYPRGAGHADYLGDTTDIHELVGAMELPVDWLPRLAQAAAQRDLDLLITPFDEASADQIDPFVPAFKVASYELSHQPLVAHIAAKGKPMIISSGAATLDEVELSLQWAREGGASQVAVLQCTAAYPARLEALNLAALGELRSRLGVPVGLSDHSSDPVIAPVLAVGLGASVIEKHFTLDRGLPGPDHAFALEPGELRALVEAVRAAEQALGSAHKVVHPDEEELRSFARRSVFAIRAIASGEVLDETAVAVLRNGKHAPGLPPSAYPEILGRRAGRAIAAFTAIRDEDLAE
jgi:sialic acid synthase SpsE